jgi:nucleotide-binding universal stress UspA family protein
MKKFLVPTDFSEVALHAADAAVELASRYPASEVHFLTRVEVHPLWDRFREQDRLEYPEYLEKLHQTKAQFRQLRDRYAGTAVPIITSYTPKDLVEGVERYCEREDIYMIVMGSSGASGLKEWMTGSYAQKIVKNVAHPVLVVKHPLGEPSFRHVVFASDFRQEARRPFEELLEFVRPFGAHVHLLHIEPPETFWKGEPDHKGRMDLFERMCWNLPCSTHEIGDVSVEAGITHFASDISADLVAIAHNAIPASGRTFGKSQSLTDALVNHLEQPLLALNTVQLKVWFRVNELGVEV